MNQITIKARAKINLALDVLNKRQDGYHNLRMIMQTVNVYDLIKIKKIKRQEILLNSNVPFIPKDTNNLAVKAARLMKDTYKIDSGVFIELNKVIPVAAGLAGGSSDAAAVLYGMNKMFNIKVPFKELMSLGVSIGADVPYCLLRGTALAEGIGEKLTSLPSLPDCSIILAKPNIHVSTASVYQSLEVNNIQQHPDIDGMIEAIFQKDLYQVVNLLGNVLETVTINKYPQIQEIKQMMLDNGALGAMMSGSGPTVFGIFDNIEKAKQAQLQLKLVPTIKQVFLTNIFNRRDKKRGDHYGG